VRKEPEKGATTFDPNDETLAVQFTDHHLCMRLHGLWWMIVSEREESKKI